MRDHKFFEGYARRNKMIPQGYVDTREGRILLADSETVIEKDGELFYRTGYALMRDGAEIANYHDYPYTESGSSVSEREERLNEAIFHARTTLDILSISGYYDDGRKHDFSPH